MTKTHIVLHHSLTDDSGTLSWPVIRDYHTRAKSLGGKGWSAIGYHIGIEWVERVGVAGHYEALLGRPLLAKAAAAYQQGMNTKGIHVLFVGDFDDAAPNPDMLQYGAAHIASICQALGIEPTPEWIIPHRQVAAYKTCPGTMFPVEKFVGMVASH